MFWVSSIKFDYRIRSKSVKRLECDWIQLPNVRLATVSVKIFGTLLCLLIPSMLVYKVWWLNRDKQLQLLSVPTIFVWDCAGEEFEGVLTDTEVNL